MNPSLRTLPIVAIGGSAGAIEPLQRIVGELPYAFPAVVLIATHVPPESVSAMPHILSRSGSLFATHAIDGAPLHPSSIILAPPNYHLTVDDGVMRLNQAARENGHRPSIDVLFRSLAEHGGSISAVLLSGALDDGVAGMREVRAAGGRTFVQDPAEASFPDMPRHAIESGAVDEILATADIAQALIQFASDSRDAAVRSNGIVPADERRDGVPSVFTCPDCGGTLWEMEGDTLRFRCRTGHAFSEASMLALHDGMLEAAHWRAIRALEERVDLLRRLAQRAQARNDVRTADRLGKQA
ncbi:MAG: chemotaxis protein CheB, partial [Candidatus Eremiobacteraeota bacterium]|nr:chemotaxis protein CheB [Candidatus Eremiobacteraeota bacterium]